MDTINSLRGPARFALFVSSYLPLFFLIIGRQVSQNSEYLNWGGLSCANFYLFVVKFGLSCILALVSIFGIIGGLLTVKKLESNTRTSGDVVQIIDIKNKNSEAIGYIATYIIPFLFQSYNGLYECLSVLFLMCIIYQIYINSSLILINPLLNIWFSIYEIEYSYNISENKQNKNGLIISENKYLDDDMPIKIYEIGHKLFFAKTIGNHNDTRRTQGQN